MPIGIGEIGQPEKITIRDVARVAGVSVGTASRVLNGRANVDPKLRSAVEEAVAALGYQPSILAQNMKSGVKRTVGLLITDITVPSLATLVRVAQEDLNREGYSVIIALHSYSVGRESELLRFIAGRVDGLIMSTCSESDEALINQRAGLKIPLVLRDRDIPGTASSVRILHRVAMKRAAEYLIDLGHRRIGIVTGQPPLYPARARIEGYEDALRERGLPLDPALIGTNTFAPAGAVTDITNLLTMPDRPTALLLGGAGLLPPTLEIVRNLGLTIPGDLSIIGASDNDLARLATPPVTVLRWSDAEMGHLCARLMLAQLAHRGSAPQHLFVPCELIIRDSCAPPRDRR